MTQNKLLIYLLTFLAVSFWAFSYIWMKVAFEYYGPVTIMFLRLSISGLLLYLLTKAMGRQQKIRKEDYVDFVLLSFFSPFCYFLGESFGLQLVTPTIAAVIIATIPVFTPLLGYLAFNEQLSKMNIAGFVISFTGVIIMVLDFNFQFSASPAGVGLLLFAVLSALINIVYLKKLTLRYSSYTIIKTQNILGALLFLPLFLFFDLRSFITTVPSTELIGSLLMLAVFASTLAFMFYTIAVREIGVARASVFTNLIPVLTAIFSYFFWGEVLEMNKVVGIIIVISGLLLSQSVKLMKKKQG